MSLFSEAKDQARYREAKKHSDAVQKSFGTRTMSLNGVNRHNFSKRMGGAERNAWTVRKDRVLNEEMKAICYLQTENHTAVVAAKKERKKTK